MYKYKYPRLSEADFKKPLFFVSIFCSLILEHIKTSTLTYAGQHGGMSTHYKGSQCWQGVGERKKKKERMSKNQIGRQKNSAATRMKTGLTKTAGFPKLCSGLWRNHNTVINSYSPHKHTSISWRYNCPLFSCNLIPYLLLQSDTFSTERDEVTAKERRMGGWSCGAFVCCEVGSG